MAERGHIMAVVLNHVVRIFPVELLATDFGELVLLALVLGIQVVGQSVTLTSCELLELMVGTCRYDERLVSQDARLGSSADLGGGSLSENEPKIGSRGGSSTAVEGERVDRIG